MYRCTSRCTGVIADVQVGVQVHLTAKKPHACNNIFICQEVPFAVSLSAPFISQLAYSFNMYTVLLPMGLLHLYDLLLSV